MSDNAVDLVTMPKWGLAMQEGTIVEWRKAEGERVTEGEPICDIETTKITNEFTSPSSGTLARIVKPRGSMVEVGEVIAVITVGSVDEAEVLALLTRREQPGSKGQEKQFGPSLKRLAGKNGSIAYIETGPTSTNTAVLFIHGFGSDHTNWGLLQAEVPATTRAIAIDLPGHGASDRAVGDGSVEAIVERVAGFMDRLGLERVHLVAHSFGAAVALRLAEQRRSQVASLLLIAPAALGATANPDYVRGFLGAERKRDMKPVMEMLFSQPRNLGRTMVNDALAILRDEEARAALGIIGERLLRDAPQSIEDDIAVIDERPSIIVWGDADSVVPMPPVLTSRLGRRLLIVFGAGHLPHFERPMEVAEVMRDLISRQRR
jgi:pyruvate dehydrogenase E2 component (dihydrolipoamide acetyltransferase)